MTGTGKVTDLSRIFRQNSGISPAKRIKNRIPENETVEPPGKPRFDPDHRPDFRLKEAKFPPQTEALIFRLWRTEFHK